MIKSSTFILFLKVMSPTLPVPTPLVRLENVFFIQHQKPILSDIHLALIPGKIVSIIGPNGAGKTTLAKMMLGLVLPTKGKVTRAPGLKVGYMPQRVQIDPLFPLTVKRFLQLGQTHAQIEVMLQEVGVPGILHQPLSVLSGGELQRVLLARALLREPELLVLDEPAQGVDLMGQGELYDLISAVRDRLRCAILLISHDLNMVMAQTDIVVCLNRHICCSGHPDKVSRDPAFTALFGNMARSLAFYTHRHDHTHEVQGDPTS
jgi:zinc transport system ATP-binding protein